MGIIDENCKILDENLYHNLIKDDWLSINSCVGVKGVGGEGKWSSQEEMSQ